MCFRKKVPSAFDMPPKQSSIPPIPIRVPPPSPSQHILTVGELREFISILPDGMEIFLIQGRQLIPAIYANTIVDIDTNRRSFFITNEIGITSYD